MGLAGDRCVAPPRRSTPGSPSSSRLALASQYPCARPSVLSPRALERLGERITETALLGGLVFEQLETLKEACLPGPDDPELLAGCRSRGLPAFERLYRDHGPRMMSIALNLLGNVADAEDAVQDAFLKIFRGGGGFWGRSALSTWIYRILVNSCY